MRLRVIDTDDRAEMSAAQRAMPRDGRAMNQQDRAFECRLTCCFAEAATGIEPVYRALQVARAGS